jgi:hypothetical protein
VISILSRLAVASPIQQSYAIDSRRLAQASPETMI